MRRRRKRHANYITRRKRKKKENEESPSRPHSPDFMKRALLVSVGRAGAGRQTRRGGLSQEIGLCVRTRPPLIYSDFYSRRLIGHRTWTTPRGASQPR
jgi:hypothetical protein